MPRSWLPFRGDDYSKENSKRYIPRAIPITTRIFGTIVLAFISGLFLYVIITDFLEKKSGFSVFGFVIVGIILIVSILAFKDSKKIAAKRKRKSNFNEPSDD
jgi:hypothetical protein